MQQVNDSGLQGVCIRNRYLPVSEKKRRYAHLVENVKGASLLGVPYGAQAVVE